MLHETFCTNWDLGFIVADRFCLNIVYHTQIHVLELTGQRELFADMYVVVVV